MSLPMKVSFVVTKNKTKTTTKQQQKKKQKKKKTNKTAILKSTNLSENIIKNKIYKAISQKAY